MEPQKKSSVGSLELISGPMFAGKTSDMLRRLLIDESIGFEVAYINHSTDTRSTGPYSTHNPLYRKDLKERNIAFFSSNKLSDLTETIMKFDIIGVDEAQFFTDLAEVVPRWVEKLSKKVIVAGLTSDFQRKKFGQLLDLEPLADRFTRLTSYCLPCARSNNKKITNAIFTYRTVKSDGNIKIGGAESYMPVCRQCYNLLEK